ncbi:MAG: hypothetical protein JWO72_2842 [Caulobacteraceae bacterium]|jgi:uncharacterized protein (DUF488 family)|nr:hypothetical protein [Caulobacteraceae bacterium]
MAARLYTIGYEQASLDQVIGALKAAGVALVLDVRAVAASRRAGFSKTMLAASLKAAGVDYIHLRALGTPKAGREAARAGRIAQMHDIFEAHLAEPDAILALAEAGEIARARPTALLCYEADAAHCHRRILADRLRAELNFDVVDLDIAPHPPSTAAKPG